MPGTLGAEKGRTHFFYGWVVVALSFADLALLCGVWYGFSAFVLAFTREFGWSRASISSVFALNMALYGFSGPAVGFLLDRFGVRRVMPAGAGLLALGLFLSSRVQTLNELYLTYGVIAGLGGSFLGSIPHNTIVSNWFQEKRGTALGITSSGMGAGMLLFIPLIQYIILHRGWREAYFMMSILAGLMVPIILIFQRHRPADMGLAPDGKISSADAPISKFSRPKVRIVDPHWASRDWTVRMSLDTMRFWALFVSFTLFAFAVQIVLIHQIAYLETLQFDSMRAASVLGIVGLVSSLAKFGWGTLSDFLGREKTFTLGMASLVLGLGALMLLPFYNPEFLTLLYVIFFGMGYGVGNPVGFSMAADLFQGKHLGAVLGILGLGIGLGCSVGPWMAGWLYDLSRSYHLAFGLAGVATALSCAGAWIAAPAKIRGIGRRVGALS
jgi:MFS family permease